ncbi:MAG: ABC transporter substrate-binding protein [bacterium]|nr:ABC transporter substrate-binding protein [bacterium]
MNRLRGGILVGLLALALVAMACGEDEPAPTTAAPTTAAPATTEGPTTTAAPERVSLVMQLTWVPQSQFAGYIMADRKGFYDDMNLDVEVLPGGPDVSPDQQIITGAADLTLGKAAAIFVARSRGVPLVAVAQFHRKSGFPIVAMADSGIQGPEDLAGKTVAAFQGGGDEVELLALAAQIGLEPGVDFELVEQGFSLDPFLNGEFDTITPTYWNELQSLYEEGFTDDDLVIIDFDDYGVGSPHGVLHTTEEILAEKGEAIARFVAATIRGWKYAFDNPEETVSVILEQAIQASELHQTNMLTALEALHFPEGFSEAEYGSIDVPAFERLSTDLFGFGLLDQEVPASDAYDTSIWDMASDGM